MIRLHCPIVALYRNSSLYIQFSSNPYTAIMSERPAQSYQSVLTSMNIWSNSYYDGSCFHTYLRAKNKEGLQHLESWVNLRLSAFVNNIPLSVQLWIRKSISTSCVFLHDSISLYTRSPCVVSSLRVAGRKGRSKSTSITPPLGFIIILGIRRSPKTKSLLWRWSMACLILS
jgi:hypothetical protein